MLQGALEGAADAVVFAGLDNAGLPRIIHANQAFCDMCGYGLSEMVGQSFKFLQGPETDRTVLDRIRDAVRTGEPIKAELANRRKDGSVYWVDLNIQPVGPAADGRFFSIQREVTRYRRADQHRSLYERLLATLLTFMEVPVCVIDERGSFILVNPCFESVFGWSEANLIGRSFSKILIGAAFDGATLPKALTIATRDRKTVRVAVRVATVPVSEARAYRILELKTPAADTVPSVFGTTDAENLPGGSERKWRPDGRFQTRGMPVGSGFQPGDPNALAGNEVDESRGRPRTVGRLGKHQGATRRPLARHGVEGGHAGPAHDRTAPRPRGCLHPVRQLDVHDLLRQA